VHQTGSPSQPFNARASHYGGWYSFGHSSPAAAAREVFKPSTDSASLLVPSQKKFSVLSSLGGTSQAELDQLQM